MSFSFDAAKITIILETTKEQRQHFFIYMTAQLKFFL